VVPRLLRWWVNGRRLGLLKEGVSDGLCASGESICFAPRRGKGVGGCGWWGPRCSLYLPVKGVNVTSEGAAVPVYPQPPYGLDPPSLASATAVPATAGRMRPTLQSPTYPQVQSKF
jgi:hypothetical protein